MILERNREMYCCIGKVVVFYDVFCFKKKNQQLIFLELSAKYFTFHSLLCVVWHLGKPLPIKQTPVNLLGSVTSELNYSFMFLSYLGNVWGSYQAFIKLDIQRPSCCKEPFKNRNNGAVLGQIIDVKPTSDSRQKPFIIDNAPEGLLSFVLPVW